MQGQWNDLHVRLLSQKTGQLLREHLRTRRGWYRIHDNDRPARPPTTLALLPFRVKCPSELYWRSAAAGPDGLNGPAANRRASKGGRTASEASPQSADFSLASREFPGGHDSSRPSVYARKKEDSGSGER